MAEPLFSFDASDPAGYSAMEMRRKIAMQMLSQKRAYPKTLGEGLASVGESLGDVGVMKALARQAAEEDATRAKNVAPLLPPGPGTGPQASVTSDTPTTATAGAPPPGLVDDVIAAAPPGGPNTRSVTAAAPPARVPVPEIPGFVRTNPDGSIAGNTTAPTIPAPMPPAAPAPGAGGRRTDAGGIGGFPQTASLDAASGVLPVGADTSRRDPIARLLLNGTAPEVPQENPTSSAVAPPSSLGSPPEAASNPPIRSDIAPAPAPGAQMAQVVPPPNVPGPPRAEPPAYDMKPPTPPQLPSERPKTTRELAAERLLLTQGHDPETRRIATQVISDEATVRNHLYARDVEAYKANMQHYTSQQAAYETYQREREQKSLDAVKTRNEIIKQAHEISGLPLKTQQEAFDRQQKAEELAQKIVAEKEKQADQTRFGRDPAQFFTQFQKEKDSASSSAATLEANRMALSAIRGGVITGSMADMRISAARLKNWASSVGLDANNEAANTQILRAAMTNALGSAVKTINGEGGVGVSNTDVKLAGMAAGADPSLELSAINQLLHSSNRINARKVNEYEDKHDYYLRGHRAEREFAIPVGETAPAPFIKTLLDNKDSKEQRDNFDKRFGEGAADLEIARAKRRERRGG